MFPCKESRFGGRRREIEARGDDGAGARAPLGSGRKKEEERIDEWVPRHPDKYLGDASRTVRRHLADCPRGGCYTIGYIPPGEFIFSISFIITSEF